MGWPQQGTPRIAVNAIDPATSLLSAPMTGATAAMAELPQIALPVATRKAKRGPSPRSLPITKPRTRTEATPATIRIATVSGRPFRGRRCG